MPRAAARSSDQESAVPRYFIRMKHPAQMAAFTPMAPAADAYRSKSHANILIAALEPEHIEKVK